MSPGPRRRDGLLNVDEARDRSPFRSAPSVDESGSPADGEPHADAPGPGQTGRRSRRVATVAAVVGALAIAVGGREPAVLLAALGGVAVVASLEALHATDGTASSARALGTLGVFGGLAGIAAVAGTAPAGWPVPALAVAAATCWIGVVATVAALDRDGARRRLPTLGWTTFVAVLGVGTAAVLLAGQRSATSAAGALARSVWAPGAWVVAGPTGGVWLPFLSLLVGALAALVLGALVVTPTHVVLSPRADAEDVEALARTREQLTRFALLAGVVAFLTYAAGVEPILRASIVLGPLVRGLLLAGIVVASAGVVAGFVLAYVWDPEDGLPGRVVPTLVGGATAAAVVTAATVAASRWTSYGLVDSLAALAGAGLVGVLALAVAAPVLLGRFGGRDTHRLIGPGATVLGAVAVAAVPDSVFAPAVAVAAAVVAWDALSLHDGLRTEVPAADAASVEQRHLGATIAVALLAILAAGAVRLGAELAGPALGGEPLVVVVAGAAVLAGIVALLARADVA